MTLVSGSKLGPYEIQSALGAGGMGEVYRARDHRLGRDVAIKVLPSAFSRDPDRLRRFEQEARAAAALNHPNILAVYDIGSHGESPYVVTELLEGETLRPKIQAGPISPRRATEYALQIARGLAAAHDQGITHRDLKPENIFITKDGRVKILDFGLAKLTRPKDDASGETATLADLTEPGLVLGTAGYMSPEQVRGKPVDGRSDLFSLGAILYEMVSGKRAFQGDTAADTMSAILKTEPLPLTETQPNVATGLARVVEHCLEKDPAHRFQSARDVAFALEAFSGGSSSSAAPVNLTAAPTSWLGKPLVLGLGAGVLLAVVAFVVARLTAPAPKLPEFHELTFQRGYLQTARFAPDGDTVVYAAAWAGKPIELFTTRFGDTESRSLGLTDTDLLAVSSQGEMAVRMQPHFAGAYSILGTMARTALSGGAPRPVEAGIEFADWSPDGKDLMVARAVGGRDRLEFPIGKVLYETAGWIGNPRFSPKGDLIAFVDHFSRLGDPGTIATIDFAGHKRVLTDLFDSAQGLAWSPNGDEIWFTAAAAGGARALYGVSPAGKQRMIARIPGILNLFDVSRSGRVLLARDDWHVGIIALAPGASKEQDFSWMDFSAIRDFSADGKLLLFDESGEAGGFLGGVYLRRMDGSPPVRLGDGSSASLSADGKWVLGIAGPELHKLHLIPTGTGQGQIVDLENLSYHWCNWLPDSHQLLFSGNEPNHGTRIYRMDISSGRPQPITPEGVAVVIYTRFISADAQHLLTVESDGSSAIRGIDGGDPTPIRGLEEGEIAFAWTGDGKSVYAYRPSVPARVFAIDLASGKRQLWKELNPPDPAGINYIRPPHISADGKSYAYNYNRVLSDLYVVDGMK